VLAGARKRRALALEQANSFDFKVLHGLLVRLLGREDAQGAQDRQDSEHSESWSTHNAGLPTRLG
jgi:hypothetical protein